MANRKGEPPSVDASGRKIFLRTEKGQHFIVDREAITKLVGEIPEGATVIEVGAGNGRLTEELARKAKAVIAIEEDERFRKELQDLARKNKNVRVIIGDALDVDFSQFGEQIWLAGNIPFNITEPLAQKAATSNIKGATLMVGNRFAQEVTSSEDPHGILGFLVRAFFKTKKVSDVHKSSFNPPPRTDASIITLEPRDKSEFANDQQGYLLREVLGSVGRGTKIKNVLIEGLTRTGQRTGDRRTRIISEENTQRAMTKNEARDLVSNLGISPKILEKSMGNLNDNEMRELYRALGESNK